MYSKTGGLDFMVWDKLQFISLKQVYSNNKNWFEEFFFVSGTWELALPKALPED